MLIGGRLDERNIAGYLGDRLCDGIKRKATICHSRTTLLTITERGKARLHWRHVFWRSSPAFEGQASREYFSRFLSVPAHKELEQAIIKVSKYRD